MRSIRLTDNQLDGAIMPMLNYTVRIMQFGAAWKWKLTVSDDLFYNELEHGEADSLDQAIEDVKSAYERHSK